MPTGQASSSEAFRPSSGSSSIGLCPALTLTHGRICGVGVRMVTDSAVDPGPLPRALVAQLEAAIVSLRADDQFRPVHLLVPNHVLGTLVSRSLFADTGYLAITTDAAVVRSTSQGIGRLLSTGQALDHAINLSDQPCLPHRSAPRLSSRRPPVTGFPAQLGLGRGADQEPDCLGVPGFPGRGPDDAGDRRAGGVPAPAG